MNYVKCVLVSLALMLLLSYQTGLCIHLPTGWESTTCKIYTGDLIGTGFFLKYKNGSYIITNEHVVDPGKSFFEVRFNQRTVEGINSERKKAGKKPFDWHSPIRIKPGSSAYHLDTIHDLAIIRVTKFSNLFAEVSYPESLIGDDSIIVPGEEIFFLGYPQNMTGSTITVPLVRQGIIAGELSHKIILDGNVFGGSSGSPILMWKGNVLERRLRVIGVISKQGRISLPEFPNLRENMGLGIGIKISFVATLIDEFLELRGDSILPQKDEIWTTWQD